MNLRVACLEMFLKGRRGVELGEMGQQRTIRTTTGRYNVYVCECGYTGTNIEPDAISCE